jgi:hypothetical protein
MHAPSGFMRRVLVMATAFLLSVSTLVVFADGDRIADKSHNGVDEQQDIATRMAAACVTDAHCAAAYVVDAHAFTNDRNMLAHDIDALLSARGMSTRTKTLLAQTKGLSNEALASIAADVASTLHSSLADCAEARSSAYYTTVAAAAVAVSSFVYCILFFAGALTETLRRSAVETS